MGVFDLLTGGDSGAGDRYAAGQREIAGKFDPTVNSGNAARGILEKEYGRQINTPDFLENQLGASWSASPYARAQQRYVTEALNNNAAATGSLGSGYSARTMGQNLQDIFSADQNRYIDRGMGTYNQGIAGNQILTQQGIGALTSQADLLSGANKAQYDAAQANANGLTGLLGQGLGLAGTVLSGGAMGPGGLAGGLGRLLPKSITSLFTAPPAPQSGFSSGYPTSASGNGSGAYDTINRYL